MAWYTVHLSYQGEKETSRALAKAAKSILGKGSKVFTPCLRGEGKSYRKEFYLVEGYVFIWFTGKMKTLLRLEEDPLFEQVVTTEDDEGRRIPEEVPASVVDSLKERLQKEIGNPDGIVTGDRVEALDGDCRNLEGEVLGVEGGNARVLFQFYSTTREMLIPLFCLRRAA